MRPILLLPAALLAACGPAPGDTPRAPANRAAGAEAPPVPRGGGLHDPPAPPPRAESLPGLAPLTRDQARAQLGPGPWCTLSDGGGPLMIARVGGAIVNDRGRIVRLTPEAQDWNALREGGRFASERVTIEVAAGAVTGFHEELVQRDASVTVVRGERAFSISHGPGWACPS